jgi:hypothetical protein
VLGSDRVLRASARSHRALASAGLPLCIDVFCVAQLLNSAKAQIAMSNSAIRRNKQVRDFVFMAESTAQGVCSQVKAAINPSFELTCAVLKGVSVSFRSLYWTLVQ